MNENENEKPTPADDATPTEPSADTTPTERLDDVADTKRLDDATETDRLDGATPTERFDTTPSSHPTPAPAADAGRYAAALEGVPRPRVRSGAIAWGLIVLAFSALMLTLTTVPGNAVAFANWVTSLTPGTITVIVVVAVGAFILLLAVLSAIRRAQRRASSTSPTAG